MLQSNSYPAQRHGPRDKEWLLARGAKEDRKQGYLLIPHVCPQLVETPEENVPTRCLLHGTDQYPLACARYHGFGKYYKPEGCGFMEGK